MLKRLFGLILVLAALQTLNAQTKEYIQAFIDKDCYLTGEQMLVHVSVTDANQKPLTMSKVAYVELCDTKQMQTQCMVQLTDGEGWAALDLPGSMHSGYYQMNVYTRYLRNFGPDCYYKRNVAVVNLLNPTSEDNIEFVAAEDSEASDSDEILTDKRSYGTREKVTIKLPTFAGRSATVSVAKKDLVCDNNESSVVYNPVFNSTALDFLPELDGHIVTAKSNSTRVQNSRLALVGKSASLFDGQVSKDHNFVHYYTSGLYGSLPVTVNGYTDAGEPVRLEFESPYEKVLPVSLPELKVKYDEKQLKDRSVSSQIEKSKRDISLGTIVNHEKDFMGVKPDYFYDLDEWTKFKTVREILIEFVSGIRVRTIANEKMLYTFDDESAAFSKWAAVALLDGMPIHDIDALLAYDARRLKYVQIYTGRFFFGKNACQGVISFISKKGSLQDFTLDEGTQMYTYSFPQDRPEILSPIYEDKSSRQPDFRHTLYFNPEVKGDCEFYTSDLPGTYVATLQYVDNSGKEYKVTSEFEVK